MYKRQKKWNNVYRLSINLKEKVNPAVLQAAAEHTLKRFLNFKFQLKRGVFWYYFEPVDKDVRIERDVKNPCGSLNLHKRDDYLFRIRYYDRRIALEVFHSITDGTGALIFLKTLTAEYLRLLGHTIPCEKGILDLKEPIKETELEDAYARYCKMQAVNSRKDNRAYLPSGKLIDDRDILIVTGIMSAEEVLKAAHDKKVSLTEYLTGLYIYSILCMQKDEPVKKNRKRPVKVAVPVSMRKFYPTDTLRNFLLFINVGIDPTYGEYSCDEIINLVHHYMRYNINEKNLNAQMSANIKNERTLILKLMPLFIKNIGMSAAYGFVGENRYTSTLSNLGDVDLPEQMKQHVDRLDFILGRSRENRMACGILSYDGKLVINFSRCIRSARCEKEFFRHLVNQGIHVKTESNY